MDCPRFSVEPPWEVRRGEAVTSFLQHDLASKLNRHEAHLTNQLMRRAIETLDELQSKYRGPAAVRCARAAARCRSRHGDHLSTQRLAPGKSDRGTTPATTGTPLREQHA